MLKLYGFPFSNYYNMVKHALLHKGVAFEEVLQYDSKQADFLDKNPAGKVPALDTGQGMFSRSQCHYRIPGAGVP